MTHKGSIALLAGNTQRLKVTLACYNQRVNSVIGWSHKGLIVSRAGHTQWVNSVTGWSHTKG